MKRLCLRGCAVAMLLIATGASAALLADFEMNDPAGTKITKLQNDAPGGGQFNYGKTNMLANGSGLFVYTYGEGDAAGAANYASAALAVQTNGGLYKMSFVIDSATLAGGGSLAYAVRDNANGVDIVKVQFLRNNSRLRLVMQDWSHVDNLTGVGTNSLPDKLFVQVIYDLDNKVANYSWTMGTETGGYSNVSIPTNTAEVVRNAYQPSGMLASDFIAVDYLKVESIPEPATLGLLGVAGGALFFLRRRMRI